MIKIVKVRNVKTPFNDREGSAGYDFYIPEDLTVDIIKEKNPFIKISDNLITDKNSCYLDVNKNGLIEKIILSPNNRILIPSGIYVSFPEGYMFTAFNKSGIAAKRGLIVGSCVVDHNYCGEVHISLINTSNIMQEIIAGEKIVQFILVRVNNFDIVEYKTLDEIYPKITKRGSGGFGSQGRF